MKLKGEVGKKEWRGVDRRRAYLVFVLAATAAAIATAILYAF